MVHPPAKWESLRKDGISPATRSEVSGGYLSKPSGTIYYQRYSLITSHELSHFYIRFNNIEGESYEKLCEIMNLLQKQPFEINSPFLNYITNNKMKLVELGLLMLDFLAKLNFKESTDFLRESYYLDPYVRKHYT